MYKLEFRDNKNLTLTNVLSKKVPSKEVFSQEKQLIMLGNWIKAKGYKTKGPLIMFSSGVLGVESDGTLITKSKILTQLSNDNIKVEYPYKFEKEIRVENCLFVRFKDKTENFKYATMELQLYAYKNDIELIGDTYAIIIDEQNGIALVDLFMPIKIGGESKR